MTSKCLYEFHIRKSRLPAEEAFPFFITVVSSDATRLERIIVKGLTEYHEAEEIIRDLEHAMNDDADRAEAAQKIAQPRFQPKVIEGWKSIETRKFIREQPKDKQRGSVLLEAALVIPLFCALIFMGLDCVWAMQEKSTMIWLASQAATCSTMPTSCSPATLVANDAAGMSLNAANLTLTMSGNTAMVSYVTTPLTPLFPSLTLTASATAAP